MTIQNQVIIDGTICTEPAYIKTAAGIPVCQWIMQHQSERYEQGIRRKIWLRLGVVICGQELVDYAKANKFVIGTSVRCTGFMGATKSRKNETQIVLHSQELETIVLPTPEEIAEAQAQL